MVRQASEPAWRVTTVGSVGAEPTDAHAADASERPTRTSAELQTRTVPRRELVTLLAYLETGSHKAAAHRLGISESTARQRVSQLLRRIGARNAAQAVWTLRVELEHEGSQGGVVPAHDPSTWCVADEAHLHRPRVLG